MPLQYLARLSVALPLGAVFIYLAGLAVYRLYFSPIARFPGPRLAALSKWYEFYYEVVLKGQFTFHIQELHKKYGPIVRITPDELHVKDSDYWDELYSRNARYDKYEWMSGRFGNSTSTFTTSKHDLHALRRGALNPFFSKRNIGEFQSVIREKVELLCKNIAKCKSNGKEFRLNIAFSAFAGDVITQYALGMCYDHLDSPGFTESFHEAFMAVSEFGHVALQFPWVHPFLNALPDAISEMMNPPLHMLLVLQRDLRIKIAQIMKGELKTDKQRTSIFQEILQSDLPPQEQSVHRLGEEAQLILGAGLETTAWALSTASFHIINDPAIFKKLRDELKQAIPDAKAQLDLLQLERLPYLSGCIQEGIRLSYGVSARNPRISPSKPTKYKDWVIPAGTPVSMTIVDVHHDEEIYPISHSFIPERWLDNPRTANASPLNRYFVAFGKGARACLGINLAYAELYLALAAVFRRFSFELYDTDISDIELAHDCFLPSPKFDSKGVRVTVKSIDD